jgi:galactokinase
MSIILAAPVDRDRALSASREAMRAEMRPGGGGRAATVSPVASLISAWDDASGSERVRALFRQVYGTDPDGVWAAPGRVNLIGEHVDYNGGLCLPIALPHRTFVALRRNPAGTADEDRVRLVSALDPHAVWSGRLGQIAPGHVRGWVAYTGGPAWALREAGFALGGFDVAIDSCVPLGAGLSSSAAIECGVAVALDDAFDLGHTGDDGRARLAAACVRAENEVAGAPTGGMDQAASLRTRAGHALLLDNLDASVRHVPFDLESAGLELLVIDTEAEHALVDGQYANRRATCHAAAERLGVATLRDVTDLDAALARLTDSDERKRVRHVVTEIRRVVAFEDLVSAGRIREVGPLLDASHASLRDDYEVSVAELDVAVESARKAGALGARMTGGGFGGSAIALIEAGTANRTADAVTAAFRSHGMGRPGFLIAVASKPAGRVA